MNGRNSSSEAVRAAQLEISAETSVEQAFQAIVGNCLQQIHGNELGVVCGRDPECIHQMRVGIRRLRTALKLFDRYIPFPESLQPELKWLGEELGDARNWDVLSGTTLTVIAQHAAPDAPPLDQLQLSALAMAAKCSKRAASALRGTRYARMRHAIAVWTEEAGWRDTLGKTQVAALTVPFGPFAARLLTRSRRKLFKRGERLRDSDAESRHRARIAAKEVRYAAEFFESLYSSRRMQIFADVLVALQDSLGRLNDLAVADRLLRTLVKEAGVLADGADYVSATLAAEKKRDLRKLHKLWGHFANMKAPRLRKA